MKIRRDGLAVIICSLCAVLSLITGLSSAYAESENQPNANSDPSLLRKCIEKIDHLIEVNGPKADYYGTKGQLLEWLQRPSAAISEYSNALKMSPGDAPFLAGRARAQRRLKNWKDALSDYNSAISSGLKNSETLVGRSLTLLSMGRFTEALSDADSALALNRQDSSAWFAKGNAELELGRAADSVNSLSKAIELKPDEPAFFELRIKAYKKLGNSSRAKQDQVSLQRCKNN